MTAIETEVIYCDDNLRRLALLPANAVDLIYLDPPFFSNRHYEVIWGDEAEVRSFEDRWEGGVHHYVEWMRERVMEMWRVLKPTGSLYLHCDPHASHYLKVMMDDVLGAEHFQNEIIWYYKGAGVSPRRWARRHDTILWYTKGKEWYFNPDPVRDEYAESTKERFSHYIGNVRGDRDFGPQTLHPRGKHPDDVWHIKIVAPSAKDRLGYPTQKPEELLERIILSSSKEGHIVLDPFAGCGTTLVVAHRLRRHWVGIDISPTACNLMKRRLAKVGALDVKLVGMPTTIEDLKALKPFEFQNEVIDRLIGIQANRKSGDMGIDGWTLMLHDPIQIKHSESVGRNVIDNFETAMTRAGRKRGFVIAFSFTRGAYEEVARVRRKGLEIHLVTVEDLLLRLDEVFVSMGVGTGLPGLEAAPMPKLDAKRYSAEELIRSGGPPSLESPEADVKRKRLLESPTGRGKVYKDQAELGVFDYRIDVRQEMLSAGQEELAGLQSANGRVRLVEGQDLSEAGPYILELADGRRVEFIARRIRIGEGAGWHDIVCSGVPS